MIEGKKQMKKLILALITLSLFACGEIEEENLGPCAVFQENYSHTVTYCEGEVVSVDVLCDYRRQIDRGEFCAPSNQQSQFCVDECDCKYVNKCWSH